MEIRIPNNANLIPFAEKILKEIKPGTESATVVCLYGDLGAGKTTLVQACAKVLGVKDTVTSPTFVILKEYEANNESFDTMVHIDAYRLEEGKEELVKLSWESYVSNPKSIIFLEWPQMVEGINMPHSYSIHIDINEDQSRTLRLR